MFTAMRFEDDHLHLIDQRALPQEENWLVYQDLDSIAVAIETMVTRGAPAIGCAAAYAIAIDALNQKTPWSEYLPKFNAGLKRLGETRPTAVNLFYAIDEARRLTDEFSPDTPADIYGAALRNFAETLFKRRYCQVPGDGRTLAIANQV